MNKLFYIGVAIALLLGANSCNKLSSTTITGRLMQSCDTPAANREGYIYLPGGGLFAKANTYIDFTTDENGYFEVSHNKSFSKFSVMTSETFSVLDVNHLEGKKKELGDVYIFPPVFKYILSLEVNNTYTELDTLFYRDLGYPQNGSNGWVKYLTGPFSNGVIDTVTATNINGLPLRYKSSIIPEVILGYSINYNSTFGNMVHVETPHCQDEYQTVTLVID